MSKYAVAAMFLASLAGCATINAPTSSQYGNFVSNVPAAGDRKMVDDAVRQLIAVYPPASTRFNLQHITPDAFGIMLVAKLRTSGYALLEFKPAAQGNNAPTGQAVASIAGVAAKPLAATLPLRYLLDLDSGSNLYRITLMVGNQSLTRAYLAQNGSVAPAGSWVRKE